ncbi:MAG: SDR family oxidoreductase [Actinobacteria bacterium]|nr:SDR family oxidoreductase [Actinomycetota bacterium]
MSVDVSSRELGAAIVTGAGSGIGRAVALELARRGYPVGLIDLSEAGLTETVGEIGPDGSVATVVADVSSADEVESAVARLEAELGPVEAAVACAGIEIIGEVTTIDLAEWRRVFSVNTDGVMHLARYCIPAIERRGQGGAFVAISSDGGVLGGKEWSPYNASKHAVIGLIRCMAMDFGHKGIRSNTVAPAFVETPMADRLFEGAEEERAIWEKRIAMERFAKPQEVAKAVAHLVSDEASFTNGHVYMVDGGETAGIYG